jgi:enterochelin esterase-like enzyme
MWRTSLLVAGVAGLSSMAAGQVLRGHIEQRSFVGPITQQPVLFNIYFPEGYAAGTQRYPVIYHLHGLGGSQAGHNVVLSASLEAAQAQSLIGPVIIVFANGYSDSWWADSIGGDKPAETDVVRQLIPYVDASFRTIPTREARVVQGFSMGGFGATKFYSKFPHLFIACVEYDGAISTWQNMQTFNPINAATIFGNSEAYFNQFSPWYWSAANAPLLRGGSPVRMVVGPLFPVNRSFRDYLLGLNISVNYVETTCGHDLACLLNAQGAASAAFIASRMNLACTCSANCDCSTTPPVLNVADFTCFLTRFAAANAGANCDGSTETPVLNVGDFTCFLQRFAAGCP